VEAESVCVAMCPPQHQDNQEPLPAAPDDMQCMTTSAPCSAVARVCVPPFLLDVLRQQALIDSITPARKESRQGQEVKQGGDKDKEDTRGEGESRQEPVS
jgi:hypothetical protein